MKKVIRYLQGTKGLMLTYRRSDTLQIEGYSDSDYAGDEKIHVRIYIYSRRRGYIVEKLQTNRNYILDNVCQVCSML